MIDINSALIPIENILYVEAEPQVDETGWKLTVYLKGGSQTAWLYAGTKGKRLAMQDLDAIRGQMRALMEQKP